MLKYLKLLFMNKEDYIVIGDSVVKMGAIVLLHKNNMCITICTENKEINEQLMGLDNEKRNLKLKQYEEAFKRFI